MNQLPETPDSWNLPFVERLFADFARDPASVAPDWRRYFEQVKNGEHAEAPRVVPSLQTRKETDEWSENKSGSLQYRVNQLVRNYRVRGHNIAAVDPLGRPRPIPPELDINFYGFSAQDMERTVHCELFPSNRTVTVREILQQLQDTYCRSIGVQYMHIDNSAIRRWLEERMEGSRNRVELTREEQVRIFTRLTDAVAFEEFIRKKFVGAKSFSLEGCESLIPLLDLAIEKAAEQGIKEIVLGMAHRGRLNVLANVLGKSPRQIFREFADDPKTFRGHGDVKYHLGFSKDWTAAKGQRVHLSLCFNPSHLEFVNPVALGRVRAKQDRFKADQGVADIGPCLALLIHGDASFAGQGVIQESLNLSQLAGYSVGGTVHVVVNNQIGFTTSPAEARSCTYATDIARMLQVPVFHVNGEDPEAVAQVVRLAMDFRETFHRDVFIDMFGYRRLGHNEGDEPSFTHPVLYRAIKNRKSVREGYLDHLLNLAGLTREEAGEIARQRYEALERELSQAQDETYAPPPEKTVQGVWSRGRYIGGPEKDAPEVATGVDAKRLAELLLKQTELPENFRPHPKIKKFLESRRLMAAGTELLDWAAAEALAFASISADGFRVRLSGQDSARGTFSQRHAILYDYESGEPFIPLRHLGGKQAPVDIINSPLSETGVLGFDYGYSLDCPDGLICWEAQYGDFVNAAQVIVDQFITSAEDKWSRLSGVVLLLPHGFEGQGPEHSSARLERFLNLAAMDNIQVVCPTTPAQYFHCLRRQVLRPWRKPLIVMTPKSLLREARAVSTLQDCAVGGFQRVIADSPGDPQQIRRILLCSGKIYYDLRQQRDLLQRQDVAILRLEQLYPFNDQLLQSALAPYAAGTPVWWVQEDPENMGAWRFLRVRFGDTLFGRFPFGGIRRPASPSPATGSARIHKKDQKYLIAQAFADV
ncbi:MAG TPA: 2-oxoglutarate dehydrogenase E1 component [Candidatus Baltobacteraceae bacterium]|jgi:2-oxoglutarate dehydrogenase E1 component|nr:2-oxoglutarate dehydrogenase E1 component [Candidatus Baltobacteraceae bacterium]